MKRVLKTHYSLLDAMMADPVNPFPTEKVKYQVGKMREGLEAFRTHQNPTNDHWEAVSDAVNMVEALQKLGNVSKSWGIEDRGHLLKDAIKALVEASERSPMRMNGSGLTACSYMIDDYEELANQLPQRVMITAHRIANKYLLELVTKRRQGIDLGTKVLGVE